MQYILFQSGKESSRKMLLEQFYLLALIFLIVTSYWFWNLKREICNIIMIKTFTLNKISDRQFFDTKQHWLYYFKRILIILVLRVEMLFCLKLKKNSKFKISCYFFFPAFNYGYWILKTKNSLNQSMCLPNLTL